MPEPTTPDEEEAEAPEEQRPMPKPVIERRSSRLNKRSLDDDCNEEDDLPSAGVPFCPAFYPTAEEFHDFSAYIAKCVKKCGHVGIFKVSDQDSEFLQVVPPKSWVARREGYEDLEFPVKRPIEQNVQSTGARGVYELTLIEKVSRTLDRFMVEAERCERITEGKNVPQIEKLVSPILPHQF